MCKTIIVTGKINGINPDESVLQFKRGDDIKTYTGLSATMLMERVAYWSKHGLPREVNYGWANVSNSGGGGVGHLYFGNDLEPACERKNAWRTKFQRTTPTHRGTKCKKCSALLREYLEAEPVTD